MRCLLRRGKCVIIGDPRGDKSEARLRALARFIHRLNGLFITGDLLAGLDSLNPGGFNLERARETGAHLYEAMQNVIATSKEQSLPTHRAADILAEQRIASVGQAKRLAIS